MIRDEWHVTLDEFQNVPHVVAFVCFIHHGNGHPFASCTSGSTNAVNVRFADVGDFKVDDMTDAFYVNATSGDVRSHEHLDVSVSESVHGFVALRLCFVAVNGLTANVVLFEESNHLVRTVFGPGEHEGSLDIVLTE
jgi:hypothetical protein